MKIARFFVLLVAMFAVIPSISSCMSLKTVNA